MLSHVKIPPGMPIVVHMESHQERKGISTAAVRLYFGTYENISIIWHVLAIKRKMDQGQRYLNRYVVQCIYGGKFFSALV